MNAKHRFLFGGIGALMPVLLTVVSLDLAVAFSNEAAFTTANVIGIVIRYASLFCIGGFIAYLQLSQTPIGDAPGAISENSRLILTYALCGFANFASIAIQIGGIGSLAPERRGDLARFGMRAVLGGSIATLMTATIAGVLIHLR